MNLTERLNQDGDMKLCLVKGNWAWFTSILNVTDLLGQDWSRGSYQTAGPPSEWASWMTEEGTDINHYRIIKVAFSANKYKEPALNRFFKNEEISVYQLNAGDYPWLAQEKWINGEINKIMAGTTFRDFCRVIREDNGHIYMEIE